jgi:exonuclease SbcD
MIKLLHTSDWHLGKLLFGRSLINDQTHFINNIFFKAVENECPDAIILAGDVFDRQIAPPSAISLFNDTVTRLSEMGIPFICITGNHDGAQRLSFGTRLFRRQGFFLTASLCEIYPTVIEKDGQRVVIHSMPYFDPPTARDTFGDDNIRGCTEAYARAIKELIPKIDPDAVNILTTHCFAAGSTVCDSENPNFVGGSGEVDCEVFAPFDYTALGHLHSPQSIGKVRYSGSPLKYSFDEEYQRKSMTLLEIESGEINVRELPIVPLHDLRSVSGSLDKLREAAMNESSERQNDYIFAELTGDPVFEPMMQLREFYPNVLSLKNTLSVQSEQQKGRDELRGALRGNGGDMKIFEQFLAQMCGAEMTEADRDIFADAVRDTEKEELQ